MEVLRPFASRLAGVIVGALCTWLAGRLGIEVTDTVRTTLESGVTLLGLGFFAVVYSIVHRFADKWLNPADVAKHPAVAAARIAAARPPHEGA